MGTEERLMDWIIFMVMTLELVGGTGRVRGRGIGTGLRVGLRLGFYFGGVC